MRFKDKQELFKDKQDFTEQYRNMFLEELGREFPLCSARERYAVLARLIASKARANKRRSAEKCAAAEEKKVYYFSMEFLIGRLLKSYLINFGINDMVCEALSEMGADPEEIFDQEKDPGIGNGGLGRLAACFIDSLASLGFAGHGNGIRYRYGLFNQQIVAGRQVEKPDDWMEDGYPWEAKNPDNAVLVNFGGHVTRHEENGGFWYSWDDAEQVLAMPYDVPIVGYGGQTVNNLRLWSAEPKEERFDMDAFNRGDYSGAVKYRSDVEAITSILYPNDSSDPGKVLRLKQEYLFVAAGLNNILKTFKKEYGNAWARFSKLVAIHTNDTHPSLCAPELLRLLIDQEGLDWDTAWDIVVNSISYTNHTVLPEASEQWPIDMFRALLPRVYDFVEEIDRRWRESFPRNTGNWQELLRNTAVLWDGQVRMANLSIIAGHSVNGVAELHSDILKKNLFKEFYAVSPEKFGNVTNGVDHRRFLLESNPPLSSLITSAIGDGWIRDASELGKLEGFCDDSSFLEGVGAAKRKNKERLSAYIKAVCGIDVCPDSVFDVQVKRFHAYKRQLLNIFKVMELYDRVLNDGTFEMRPTTFIFAGKAAQGYEFAKEVIRLINAVADVINNDPLVKDRIKVVFIPNFSVSNAQLIYPAADISEQISTAGKEASGTGNMKFMFNGAVTLGTLDGSTVEICERLGGENIGIFGLRAEETDVLSRSGSYFAWDEYNGDDRVKKVVDQLTDGTFAKRSEGFEVIYDSIMRNNDEFFVLKDFSSYLACWQELEKFYGDRERWLKASLINTARAGYFSSDRSISDYAREIWKMDR